jgi:DNA/RNA-binding domain of Phe-tRNA-synthetase-like protein
MKFAINKEIFSKFAPLKIAAVVLENINNKANIDDFFNAEYAAIEESVKAKFGDIELANYPIIRRWREIYKSFGEKDARSSIEALIKRIRNGKGLYRINPLVDLYNLTSLKYELPAGGEDCAAIASGLELTFANGDEKFLPLGGAAAETPNAGEVIYKSGNTVACRNFNYRESDITKLTDETTRAIIVFEDAIGNDANLRTAVDWISENASSLLGAKAMKSEILEANNHETIL